MLSTPPVVKSSRLDRLSWLVVVALTLATAAGALVHLGERSIWWDEGTSIWYATSFPWRALVDQIVTADPNMSFYHGLLYLWRHPFGSGVFAMRGLSVTAAALTVPLVFVLGRRVFGTGAGLVAAAALAINAFFLRYAQEARGYALVTFLVTVSSYFFFVQLAAPSRTRDRAGYVVTSTLAFYTHFFAAFVLVGHAAYLALVDGREAFRRRWAIQYGTIALLSLPIVYASATVSTDPIGWLPPAGWSMFDDSLRNLAGGTHGLLIVYIGIVVAGLVLAIRTPELRQRLAFPALWIVIPIALAFAISQASPILFPRYLVIALPAVALLAGGVLTHLPKALALALAVAVIGLSVPALDRWYSRPPNSDWKAATRYVLANHRPGDGIVILPVTYVFKYYAERTETPSPDLIPAITEPDRVESQRVWVVTTVDDTRAQRALERTGYRRQQRRSFTKNLVVELHVRARA